MLVLTVMKEVIMDKKWPAIEKMILPVVLFGSNSLCFPNSEMVEKSVFTLLAG